MTSRKQARQCCAVTAHGLPSELKGLSTWHSCPNQFLSLLEEWVISSAVFVVFVTASLCGLGWAGTCRMNEASSNALRATHLYFPSAGIKGVLPPCPPQLCFLIGKLVAMEAEFLVYRNGQMELGV